MACAVGTRSRAENQTRARPPARPAAAELGRAPVVARRRPGQAAAQPRAPRARGSRPCPSGAGSRDLGRRHQSAGAARATDWSTRAATRWCPRAFMWSRSTDQNSGPASSRSNQLVGRDDVRSRADHLFDGMRQAVAATLDHLPERKSRRRIRAREDDELHASSSHRRSTCSKTSTIGPMPVRGAACRCPAVERQVRRFRARPARAARRRSAARACRGSRGSHSGIGSPVASAHPCAARSAQPRTVPSGVRRRRLRERVADRDVAHGCHPASLRARRRSGSRTWMPGCGARSALRGGNFTPRSAKMRPETDEPRVGRQPSASARPRLLAEEQGRDDGDGEERREDHEQQRRAPEYEQRRHAQRRDDRGDAPHSRSPARARGTERRGIRLGVAAYSAPHAPRLKNDSAIPAAITATSRTPFRRRPPRQRIRRGRSPTWPGGPTPR